MHLAALVESEDHVCCRYRLAAFRPYFEQAGHQIQFHPWPSSWLSRLALPRRLRQADVVIIQRKLLPTWYLSLLRRSAKLLIFDFDDAVFLRDSYSAKGIASPARQRRFQAMMAAVDGVAAGNSFLAGHAARHSGSAIVRVIPTCVAPAKYPAAGHNHSNFSARLVWVGSSSTLNGLEAVRPLLEAIGRRVPGVRLKLICDRFIRFDHLVVDECPWNQESETADIAAADIGISWLPDDDWSCGKCGLKVLQYMAAGLPVVANPVGVQAEMVRHGETGFLASTEDEWAQAVGRLASDPALRRKMGAAGRRCVENEFSAARGAESWLGLLESIASRRAAA